MHLHITSNMVAEPCGSAASQLMPLDGGSPDETAGVAKLIPKERTFAATAEFLDEKRNLLSVAYRADEQQAASAREFVIKVEDELQKFRDGILALMEKNLIPSASTGESKMTHYTRVGDYNRYLAELATVEAENKECVDRMNGDPNDIYSIIGESIVAVSSFLVLGIVRKKSLKGAEDCRDSTGAVHWQDHRCVGRDATWCSHHSNCTENCGSAADSIP